MFGIIPLLRQLFGLPKSGLISWLVLISITKTCLYNFDPHKLHFYIVELGLTGIYNIFLISAKNIDCGYSLEPPPSRKHAYVVLTPLNPTFM